MALKVLKDRPGGADGEALRHEIRLVAGLEHPAIIRVLDSGEMPSGGPFPTGSPFLVMELMQGGSLGDEVGRIGWPRLRWVLLRVLDGLAHAHAHGVIHRDLKPANLLRSADGGRVVISDFGISGRLDDRTEDETVSGTPSYMAPEQLLGAWREQGPWTDLYSLGSVAWTLATGRWVFGRGEQAIEGHMREQPGDFVPRASCPPGFETWLRRLLRKPPGERFHRAADAAAALAALPEAVGSPPGFASLPTPAEAPTLILEPVIGRLDRSQNRPDTTIPRLPGTWRQACGQQSMTRTRGRGIVGMRALRVVGRSVERDRLWRALGEVIDSGSTAGLMLRGPAGVGKSRLAWWLCTRAHELGVSSVLIGRHSEDEPEGLGPMIARSVHGLGLEGDALGERLAQELPELGIDDRLGLQGLVRPGTGLAIGRSRWREAVLLRWLGTLAARRPLIVWLDDVHWSASSLALVHAATHRGGCGPVLFVLTVQDEGAARCPSTAEALAALPVPSLPVGPLPRECCWELVSELLGLTAALTAQVVDRAAGSPLLAIQLVEDQVARDQLVVGESGLELRPGAELRLPRDLDELWQGRLAAVARGRDTRALELAALLGSEVSWAELDAALRELGLIVIRDLLKDLFDEHLLVPEGRLRFRFAHGMLREVLLRRVEVASEGPRLHAACAAALEATAGSCEDALSRRGRHLFHAGALDAALPMLRSAVTSLGRSGRFGDAAALLELCEVALLRIGIDTDDPLWAEHRCQELELLVEGGAVDAGTAASQRLLSDARKHGWVRAEAMSLRYQGRSLRSQGRLQGALVRLEEAIALWRRLDDPRQLGVSLTDLADVLTDLGRHREAESRYRAAARVLEPLSVGRDLGCVFVGLAELARQRKDWSVARSWLEQGRRAYAAGGNRWGEAVACNDLADYDRREGRLDAALEGFREARRRQVALGYRPFVPEVNIGLTLAAMGRHEEAVAALEPLETYLDEWRRGRFAAHVRAGLLSSLGRLDRRPDFAMRLDALGTFLEESGLVDEELAEFLETGAAEASVRGWAAEAARARRLAEAQRRALGPSARADRPGSPPRG